MRDIGAVLFDGFEMLDLFGPLEIFCMFPKEFRIVTVAETAGPVAAHNGPSTLADVGFQARQAFDVLLVPGGPGVRRATSNKLAYDWVAGLAPDVDWQHRARWVEDGPVFTASGVSAGIDMALAVVERLLGPKAADDAARWAEYNRNADPDHDHFAR